MNKRILTSHKGVYQRESTEEIFKGKPNLCFDITYKRNGKKIFEKIGWLSEGFTAKLAADIRAQRMKQLRFGEELPKDKVKAPLFTDVADKYFLWAETNLTRGGSLERFRYDKHMKDFFNGKRMNEISTFDLERLKATITSKELSIAPSRKIGRAHV